MIGRARTRVRLSGVVTPALLVCAPLVAFSFQGDERRNIYYNAERFGSNPLQAARQAVDEIDVFLRLGNFRPLGRFFDYSEHAAVFEAAEATGLAPHVVHGVVRMAMVALVALVAWRLVASVVEAAGGTVPWHTPAFLAIVLVAGGQESPLVHFPFLFLLSAVIVLGAPPLVVRVRDLTARRIGSGEGVACAAFGAAAAMFFDLVYVVIPLTLVYIAAVGFAARVPLRRVVRSAAIRRFIAMAGGFFAVFVPVRLLIASECGDGGCYSGSDLDPTLEVPATLLDRMLSGTPPAAWRFNADLLERSGAFYELRDLLSNSLLLAIVFGLVAWTWTANRRRPVDADEPGGDVRARTGLALVLVGAALITLPALLVSLSTLVQREAFAVGESWRDSVLVQIGWGVVFTATCGVVLHVFSRGARWGHALRRAGLGVIVVGGLVATLLANARLQEVDRRDPVANLTNQISAASVDFDLSPGGNTYRCDLLDRYTVLAPDPGAWVGGPMLRDNLDRLATARHGRPFCESG